jgi:hemolysin D
MAKKKSPRQASGAGVARLFTRCVAAMRAAAARWRGPEAKPSAAIAAVRQFQSEADGIREAPEPLAARATVFVLAGMLLTTLLIMTETKIDRVVTSMGGKIVPSKGISVFQALDPSLIKTIDVREGDQVKAGQLLATLDPTFAAADVTHLRRQVAGLEALVIRAEAQLAGRIPVYEDRSDPNFAEYAALQKALYKTMIAQYTAQVNSFDGKIKLAQATIQKLQANLARYGQREEIARQVELMRTTLAEHGTGSQLNMLTSQDSRLEMLRQVENDRNGIVEAQQTMGSAWADRQAYIQQWSSQISQELVKARNELDTARSQLEKALKHHDLVRLIAPEPSMVLTMAKLSVGSVLKEGDALFTLMPLNTPVEAEIRIASRDIGFVRPGDHCVIKVEAFNFAEHGMAEGTLRWISDGAFTTDDDNRPIDAYYRGRCDIETTQLINMPANFRLIPGMTLTADLKVGRRSVAMYLLGGILRGFSESMREP